MHVPNSDNKKEYCEVQYHNISKTLRFISSKNCSIDQKQSKQRKKFNTYYESGYTYNRKKTKKHSNSESMILGKVDRNFVLGGRKINN